MDKQSTTRIYGLIGYPVEHSLSPEMHNAAFKYLKEHKKIDYDAEYCLFEVKPENLKEFFGNRNKIFKDTKGRPIRAGDVRGFNITIPHKVRALELAFFVKSITAVQDRDVVLSGAINTVKRDNEKLHYCNTDIAGFMKSLIEDLKFNATNKNILIFGCGGAGRAIIAGLTCKGINVKKIYIYDVNKDAMDSAKRHFDKFSDLMEGELKFISTEQIPDKIKDSDLLVNASPVGMNERDGSVIDKDLLHEKLSVYDVVYNRETQLIRDAKSLGRTWADGLGMLLYQGAEAFEFWTDQEAPVEIMRKALIEALSK